MAMQSDIEFTLRLLSAAGVRFIVVGGVAVVLHGYLRLTADLDLVLDLAEENVSRAVEALSGAGFVPRAPVPLSDFSDPARRRSWIAEKNMQVLSLWHAERHGFEVDVFVDAPFPFDPVFDRAVRLNLGGIEVAVISVEDLIAMKRAAGRVRDMEDVAALEALRQADE